jgi:hypothetical protein
MTLPADRILLGAPIWAIGLTLFVLLIGMMLLGIAVRRRTERRAASEGEDAQEGYIVSGALGLLALLLGFTFAMAVDRYDNRRSLVLEEANAIGTTYLRAQLLDEPFRSRLSRLLEGYTASRIRLATADSREQRAPLMAQSDDYQQRLWAETVAAVRPIRALAVSARFVDAMNATIDAGAARVASRRAHVPSRVLVMLAIYMLITAYILGYAMSAARRRSATAVLLALTTLAYTLILDIDRPTGGRVLESQASMEDLLAMMRKNPPASFGTVVQEAAPVSPPG